MKNETRGGIACTVAIVGATWLAGALGNALAPVTPTSSTTVPAGGDSAGPVVVPISPSPAALVTPRAHTAKASRSRVADLPRPGTLHLNWVALRECESSNNYNDRDSATYRGAYQFDRTTWATVGGNGDPADASPAEQDMRALKLYAARGRSPWPVCGRHL